MGMSFVAKSEPSKTVLIPLPGYGFDPTESSVPWKKIFSRGHHIVFATPDGRPAQADLRMVTGEALPSLLKKSLMAQPEAVSLYREMTQSAEFQHPISYDQIQPEQFDALLLVGGHDKGMRAYLESKTLQKIVAFFYEHDYPVGAICHGTLLAARSISSNSGRSVLWGRKTTGLTRQQEMIAYKLTRLWLGDYYRTYQIPMMDELVSYLQSPNDYFRGPGFPIPLKRDSEDDLKPGFVVRDGKYLSARWPGDAYRFANDFVEMVEGN